MKSRPPYLIIVLLAAAIVVLFVTGSRKKPVFDKRITLRKQDKIPYGTYVAYKNLHYLFPEASVYVSRDVPGYWDSVSIVGSHQAFISISDYFNAEEYEMKNLFAFVEKGNDVFISAREISDAAEKAILSAENKYGIINYFGSSQFYLDSLSISLIIPHEVKYVYPGRNFSSTFRKLNRLTTEVLGKDSAGNPNFIHLRAGEGNFYLQLAPLAFSNYFLLHKNNIGYYETAFSVIGAGTKKIIWDEYYLRKRSERSPEERKKSWVTVLMSYPALRAGLLTGIVCLLLYVLFEMRRKQRFIPVIAKPRNDSLDFVRTIGRLYHEKADHKNLCRKMTAYFLEYVRSKYKMATSVLDETFIRNLQYKTGADMQELREIVSFVKYVEDAPVINATELKGFHRQLEAFYKKA